MTAGYSIICGDPALALAATCCHVQFCTLPDDRKVPQIVCVFGAKNTMSSHHLVCGAEL